MRGLLALLVLVLGASVGVAQDMPLFTFTRLGAKWEQVWEKAGPQAATVPPVGVPGAVTALSKDGATVYAGYADRAAVWAYPVKPDGKPDLTAGAPYAPLRIVEGYDNSRDALEKRRKNPPTLAVTALAVDDGGRIYAATKKDIQAFDPTGRLCGVLPLPKAGAVVRMRYRPGPTPALIVDVGTLWTRELK